MRSSAHLAARGRAPSRTMLAATTFTMATRLSLLRTWTLRRAAITSRAAGTRRRLLKDGRWDVRWSVGPAFHFGGNIGR